MNAAKIDRSWIARVSAPELEVYRMIHEIEIMKNILNEHLPDSEYVHRLWVELNLRTHDLRQTLTSIRTEAGRVKRGTHALSTDLPPP